MISDLIAQTNSQEWLDALATNEKSLILELTKVGLNENQIAEFWLGRSGSSATAGFGGGNYGSNYLRSIKAEFRKLICGDPSYSKIRSDIAAQWANGKTYVITLIAVAVSSALGVAVGVVTPIVALLLSMVCRIGTNAWCALPSEDVTTV